MSHTLRAFNALADEKDRLTDAEIEHFVTRVEPPPHLSAPEPDPSYGGRAVLFRRTSGRVRVTIFDGGHDMITDAAFAWLAGQQRTAS